MMKISRTFLCGAVSVMALSFSLPAQAAIGALPAAGSGNSQKIDVAAASDEIVTGARNFIQSVSQRGLSFLSNDSLTHQQRRSEFRDLLNDSFDLPTIGRFALGRYWRVASPEQREDYLRLFREMVIDTYAQRFSEYQGQELKIDGARTAGDKDVLVHSVIISPDSVQNVKVDWRVRYKNGQYNIVDVMVEGVSMTLTQRSEFASIIQRGGGNVEALLSKLRSR